MTIATLRSPKTSHFAAIILAFSAIHCAPEASDARSMPRDNFETRLAQGCKTSVECTNLYDEAEARYQTCVNAALGRDPRKCEKEIGERERALNRGRELAAQAERKERTNMAEHSAKSLEANDQYTNLKAHLDRSCESIKKLETALTNIEPDLENPSAFYRSELAKWRRDGTNKAKQPISLALSHSVPTMEGHPNPDEFLSDIAPTRAALMELRCWDAALADSLQPKVDTWAAELTKAVNNENVCRKTPSCLGPRLAAPICEIIDNRRMYTEQMAQERRNPSGVVNLNTLHELGRDIQHADEDLAFKKEKYQKQVGSAFTQASCKK